MAHTGSSGSLPGLAPVWHYPRYTEVGPWDAVNDCYALIDDTCTWACYYADFPVVRIRDGAVTGWHNEIRGASALAVAGSRGALFGGSAGTRHALRCVHGYDLKDATR